MVHSAASALSVGTIHSSAFASSLPASRPRRRWGHRPHSERLFETSICDDISPHKIRYRFLNSIFTGREPRIFQVRVIWLLSTQKLKFVIIEEER